MLNGDGLYTLNLSFEIIEIALINEKEIGRMKNSYQRRAKNDLCGLVHCFCKDIFAETMDEIF